LRNAPGRRNNGSLDGYYPLLVLLPTWHEIPPNQGRRRADQEKMHLRLADRQSIPKPEIHSYVLAGKGLNIDMAYTPISG
jgi:hypothetical protein